MKKLLLVAMFLQLAPAWAQMGESSPKPTNPTPPSDSAIIKPRLKPAPLPAAVAEKPAPVKPQAKPNLNKTNSATATKPPVPAPAQPPAQSPAPQTSPESPASTTTTPSPPITPAPGTIPPPPFLTTPPPSAPHIPVQNLEQIGEPAPNAPAPEPATPDKRGYATAVCKLLAESAAANNLSLDFLTRLIWRESYFNDRALSPAGAQGIAQFMPGTAKIRGLKNPYDYTEAIPAAAAYLSFLKTKFGNLGLAAAAYNLGEDGTSRWLNDKRLLPYETEDYVLAITGRPADDWQAKEADFAIPSIGPKDNYPEICQKIVMRELMPQVTIVDSAPLKPWGVMIAGGFSQSRTLATFARVKQKYAALLADELPLVVRKRNLSRGRKRLVMVMIGRNSRKEAQNLCSRMQKLGAPCIVVKN